MLHPWIARIVCFATIALASPSVIYAQQELLQLNDDGSIFKPESKQVAVQTGQSGVDTALLVHVEAGEDSYPGLTIKPATGDAWNLSEYGHISIRVSNTGETAFPLSVRVDNPGDWKKSPWNTEKQTLKPGETKDIKVIFGYQYGYKKGFDLDPSKVSQILLHTHKAKEPLDYRIDAITAGGEPGEKPATKPENVRIKPVDGVILGRGVDLKKDLELAGEGVSTSIVDASAEFRFDKDDAYGAIKPAEGKWNLTDALQVEVTVKNTGDQPVTPRLRVHSDHDKTPWVSADGPLKPGDTTQVVVPFEAGSIWIGPETITKGHMKGKPGTGNSVRNDRISAIVVSAQGPGQLQVQQITASAPPVITPDWLGQRPPVSGDWALTFEDNFDGSEINLEKWNIYTENYWDKRSHFSRDNVLVGDGNATLHYEKKTGYANDNPNDTLPKTGKNESDYAVGYLDTYDMFTQTYGYFEARMKLPEADGLWPAFWMMPDRGTEGDPSWKRRMTGQGGMEFDIMEHLTRWGPYRYNIAMHWDGYGDKHKATGSTVVYAGHDQEGYITSGLLWLPGEAVFYANGREVARWTNDRISNIPSYVILYMVSGGWDNNALDDDQLPADFDIDYVRIWQRSDLVK